MQDAHTDKLNPAGRGRSRADRLPIGGAKRAVRRVQGSTAVLVAAVSLLPISSAPAVAPATRPAAETVVRLHAAAVVTGDQVMFRDIAEISGEAAGLVAGWPISAAPRAGTSGALDTRHLQMVLARRGVNLSNWVFRGSSRCVVSRPAESPAAVSRPNHPTPTEAPQKTRQAPATRPSAGASSTGPSEAAPVPGTLQAAIHDHLRGRLAGTGGTLSVRFSPATARLTALSAPQYEFRIVNRGERALGIVPLEVTVLEQGRRSQVVQVVCEAALRKQVIVAGRMINRGEIVQGSDLAAEERVFERLDEVGLEDRAPLLGQRARRMIHQGEALSLRDMEPVPLVSRNDLVTVTVRRGGLVITAAARAMSAGCYGETVTLRSELSKETFSGMVTGPKTVNLIAPKSDVALAGGGR